MLTIVCACQLSGYESHYGRADHEMNFAEVALVLEEDGEDWIQNLPFIVVGQGRLPGEYGPERENYLRASIGHKIRFPFRFKEGKYIVYVEVGGMASYYEADAIGTPFEPEFMAGIGTQLDLGSGWRIDLAARVRNTMGNGHRHEVPEHAPDDAQLEVVIGVKKDF